MKKVETFRIAPKAVEKIKGKLSEETFLILRKNENTCSSSEKKFEELIRRVAPEVINSEMAVIKKACLDKWSYQTFNSLQAGEVYGLQEGLQIRRVPGGWNYEYTKKTASGVEITAATFVSTDELKTP